VRWSEIQTYKFDVYEGWEEIPVSIADPGRVRQMMLATSFDEI